MSGGVEGHAGNQPDSNGSENMERDWKRVLSAGFESGPLTNFERNHLWITRRKQ